jgi:arsenate reductase
MVRRRGRPRSRPERLAIMYRDPKASDGTPEEQATYDARCQQIAAEMNWVMALVEAQLKAGK